MNSNNPYTMKKTLKTLLFAVVAVILAVACENHGKGGANKNSSEYYVFPLNVQEDGFEADPIGTNLRAIETEVKKARAIAPKGIIGVNIMVAAAEFMEAAKTAVEEGVDVIIAGEESYAAMKRSTNGGGENAPMLEGEDDFYELFMAGLSMEE